MNTKTIGELSAHEIRELVAGKYSEVALQPRSGFKFRVGKEYALDLGYPVETIAGHREVMAESFTGVSSFLAHFEDFAVGEVILELGAGAGLDTASLARKVGPEGKVIGLDLSLAMIRKATGAIEKLAASQARCCQAQAEYLPLADSSADWVVSNGIFNLSPEKEKILVEIHRVLKPKGHVLCSEIVLDQEPSPEQRLNEDDWFK